MAAVRIICEPTECCVQPSAYMMVIVAVGRGGRGDHLADLEELVLAACR